MRLRFLVLVALILTVAIGCAPATLLSGSNAPRDRLIERSLQHGHGYQIELRDGRSEFIDDPAVYAVKIGKHGQLITFSGKGFALAVKADEVRVFSRNDGNAKTALAIPAKTILTKPQLSGGKPLVGKRRPLFDPVCGVDGCYGGGGNGCDATTPDCATCPDCSYPIPGVGDPVDCYYSSSCGDDGRGNAGGTGLIATDEETTCLYDFSTHSLDCGYNNSNPPPSASSGNLNIGYLHSGASVRLACNTSHFAPLPVVGFATYKDSSQVYTKQREIDLSPDYWFVPDETGKPIPPPPPAHTSISSQYEYFGIPLTVAGHCDGSD